MKRIIVHIDLDCFYCQVEQIRTRTSPDIPLAVLQWDSLIAVNYSARKFNVSRFSSKAEAIEKCPEIKLIHVATFKKGCTEYSYVDTPFPSSHKVSLDPYRKASAQIFKIFKRFIDCVQKTSIDEAYIDFTDIVESRLKDFNEDSVASPLEWNGIILQTQENKISESEDDLKFKLASHLVQEIRDSIFKELGFTCSAGIAENKTLAKICSSLNKPNNQTILRPCDVLSFLSTFPFQKIKNLGGNVGKSLETLFNAKYASDLWKIPLSTLQNKFSESTGKWIYDVVRGICNDPVKHTVEGKSFLSAKSLRPSASSKNDLIPWLIVLVSELEYRIKEEVEFSGRYPKNIIVGYFCNGRSRTKVFPMISQTLSDFSKIFISKVLSYIDSLLSTAELSFPCERISLQCTNFNIPSKISAINTLDSWVVDKRKDNIKINTQDNSNFLKRENEKKPTDFTNKRIRYKGPIDKYVTVNQANDIISDPSVENAWSQPLDDNIVIYKCPKCQKSLKNISGKEIMEHNDYHFAMTLSKMENNL